MNRPATPIEAWPGRAFPLGAAFDGTGTNFAIFSEVADAVDLCLFDDSLTERRVRLEEVDGKKRLRYILRLRNNLDTRDAGEHFHKPSSKWG